MAEERSQVTADEIRSAIESTRAEMTATIDAIQERLRPAAIAARTTDNIREAAARLMNHPVALSLVGLAAVMIAVRAGRRRRRVLRAAPARRSNALDPYFF